jgi:hypothetical protein
LSNSHFTVGFSIPALVKRDAHFDNRRRGIQIRIDEIKILQSFYPLIILKHQALVNHQL